VSARADFEVVGWDQIGYDDDRKLARATVRKTFKGGLEGESVAELPLTGEARFSHDEHGAVFTLDYDLL
jgi:hypothetical protein